MNFVMTEEQELLAATLRRFADKELRGWAAEADRRAQPPEKLFAMGADLGLFVDAVPEDAGGMLEGAFSHLSRALRGFELGRGCAGLAGLLESNVEPALALARWATPALQAQVFAELADGALVAMAHDAHGRIELAAGATPKVSGTVGPVPAAARASRLMLLAQNTAGDKVLLLLPKSCASVESTECSGWRAGAWATWTFDEVSLAPEHIVLVGPQAAIAHSEILSWANLSLAARALGVASAAIEHATAYGKEREQFGQAIGEFESIIRLRDKNETAIRACRLLVLEAAMLLDAGKASAGDVASRARDLSSDVVTRATIDAVQIYGGYGFVNDYPVEKLMRDARAFEVLHGNTAFLRVLSLRKQEN